MSFVSCLCLFLFFACQDFFGMSLPSPFQKPHNVPEEQDLPMRNREGELTIDIAYRKRQSDDRKCWQIQTVISTENSKEIKGKTDPREKNR